MIERRGVGCIKSLQGPGGRLRHVAYTAGWKKLEPLWDWVIRARRISGMLPLLEAVLAGLDRRGQDEPSPHAKHQMEDTQPRNRPVLQTPELRRGNERA